MRIVAGAFRGLNLESPEGLNTRPTLGRVKEALFSSLTPYFYNASVLDAFAGSGALGLEALSRGAKSCHFIEKDKKTFEVLRKNIEKTKTEKAIAKCEDVLIFLDGYAGEFDLVFLDPPYEAGLYEKVLEKLYDKVNENSLIVLEFDDATRPTIPDKYLIVKEKSYGRVKLTYLKKDD